MQLMSWMMSRLGSRFSLLFEPHRQRVMHSALGRFLDQPLDLMVGLEEPDGTTRVLPFTCDGECLYNTEQFERLNSITFRGYSERYNLRFEFNIHSVFYPQDTRLCVMPAIYLEMRVNPVDRVRWNKPIGPRPRKVNLFIRLRRPDTHITAADDGDDSTAADDGDDSTAAHINLTYANPITPQREGPHFEHAEARDETRVQVHERIVSLNTGCTALESGDGLRCELPVTEENSGIKWRLVWAAHVSEPVMQVKRGGRMREADFLYNDYWSSLDEVIQEAIDTRDDRLAHSRRLEKLIGQAPIDVAERHLLNQSFQNWLSNTFWLRLHGNDGGDDLPVRDWFSVWEGSCFYHSTLDVEYNVALVYLTLWPRLLAKQFPQWAEHCEAHEASGGCYLSHDLGAGTRAATQAYPHPMEVEENADFLLMLQAYTHWTADRKPAEAHADLIEQLVRYLLWTDRDGSGFPSEGVANTIDDASAAVQFARKQTYLAVKRAMALNGAGTLLTMLGREELARECEERAESDMQKIDRAAWLGDHYAVCVEPSAAGVMDAWTGQPLPYEQVPGWDAYSIYSVANGILLPTLIGQPLMLDGDRMRRDIANALRETLSRYGCGHTSIEPENVWVSQNLWRDYVARYMNMSGGLSAQHYWDMQVMSNTHHQSLGYVDTYINNNLSFYPRGITSIGALLAGPRLIIDRLAAGGLYITVEPDRHTPQRWPLLPLADWRAGKIPVCVVDRHGRVTIESRIDPVVIHGNPAEEPESRSAGLIG